MLLAGDHLSHFLAIFELLAFTAPLILMRDHWTFKISVGQLSESLLKQLSDAMFKYTVPLIVDDLVIGTATLAQIDRTASASANCESAGSGKPEAVVG